MRNTHYAFPSGWVMTPVMKDTPSGLATRNTYLPQVPWIRCPIPSCLATRNTYLPQVPWIRYPIPSGLATRNTYLPQSLGYAALSLQASPLVLRTYPRSLGYVALSL